MQGKKEKVNRRIILVVCFIWFVSILAFLIYAAQQKLVEFDQEGKLWQQSQNISFDNDFKSAVSKQAGEVNSSVIHFFQGNCECNPVAKEHIDSVQLLAQQQGFKNISLNVSDNNTLDKYIPATPAVAIFAEDGSLSYLGPYSAGYSCTVGNGIVESYLEYHSQLAPGATVVTNTQGCYCSV